MLVLVGATGGLPAKRGAGEARSHELLGLPIHLILRSNILWEIWGSAHRVNSQPPSLAQLVTEYRVTPESLSKSLSKDATLYARLTDKAAR